VHTAVSRHRVICYRNFDFVSRLLSLFSKVHFISRFNENFNAVLLSAAFVANKAEIKIKVTPFIIDHSVNVPSFNRTQNEVPWIHTLTKCVAHAYVHYRLWLARSVPLRNYYIIQ
jgi:hypothetical protein